MLHQCHGTLLVTLLVEVELHEHHPLAGVGIAEHHVAQQSMLGTKVEERELMLVGIVADGVAHLVVKVVHQAALLDGINLVESSRDVEANGIHVVKGLARRHLFPREPALVAASEVELVAVFAGLHRSQNWHELRQLHLANARKLVVDLLLLGLDLLLIGQVLPLAAAANAKVLAHGRRAYITIFMETYHFRFAIVMLFPAHLQVDHVARHTERHEHHHLAHTGKRLALGGNVGYFYILQYG